jgi:hypothetical protein
MPNIPPPPVRALVCIERPEEMGRLNSEPTIIRFEGLSVGPNGEPEATLQGGQNVCFKVHHATGRLTVKFAYPYLGPSERPVYWTTAFPVAIKRRENDYELSVSDHQVSRGEAWEKTGWHGMWRFETVAAFCHRRLKWPECPDPGGE